ncbi:DUF4281 domain-containing protein [Erythrobacter arachoides]|uniref:DUF4281 domain-containing protein n=1 Tax=Aurantiacibacter arachoides TaxID=1850444 RepID=A0A845A3N7_9SPHN|nr:ABA4-like family protein [Aurantiacibacter arachoides]MXO93537.1 DUF4281 domain-containing protein [Aurantiacibacter arachoides]GGD48585.1 hypothetical protein GCM10011411_05440 [Aurantiacibacter arachoides]
MNWDALFTLANLWALVMWGMLIALPRGKLLLAAVMYAGVGLLCLAYAVVLVLLVTGTLDGGGPGEGGASFTTIEGVRAIFGTDGGVTAGWIHYLALDLFAGLWIARDADAKRFSRLLQAPVLLLTFVAGPFGLLVWLLIRERRARQVGRGRAR